MNIEDYIPFGYRNKIDRVSLEIRTGYGDRQNRQLIEEAIVKRRIPIANVGGGYFRPDGSPEDTIRWREYCLKELKRTSSQNKKSRVLRSMLPPERKEPDNQMDIFDFIGGGEQGCRTGL